MAQRFDDLAAFTVVAQERSFTRAGAKLGVSPSALSQTIKALESRLGIRLLDRTTRSVSPTEAGERLLKTVAPRFADIEQELAALGDLRERPSGTIRISAGEHPVRSVLQPRLSRLLGKGGKPNLAMKGKSRRIIGPKQQGFQGRGSFFRGQGKDHDFTRNG